MSDCQYKMELFEENMDQIDWEALQRPCPSDCNCHTDKGWNYGVGKGWVRGLTVYIFSAAVVGLGLGVLMYGFPPGTPEEVVKKRK